MRAREKKKTRARDVKAREKHEQEREGMRESKRRASETNVVILGSCEQHEKQRGLQRSRGQETVHV